MLTAFFSVEGHTDPALRAAVAASAGGTPPPGPRAEIPAELLPFLEKVRDHAYKVTDEDIAALRAAGWSEDAIFELTLAGALGASLARLDAALALLPPEGA